MARDCAGTDGAIPVVLGTWYDRVTAELASLLLVNNVAFGHGTFLDVIVAMRR